jgi:hypothetical protein
MVDDLEAMGVPVLGDLEGPGLDKLKKEILLTFISSNPDYDERWSRTTTATSATTLTCTHTACKCSRG